MNIAGFLHGLREDKDWRLPLPLAPTYTLPHHRWYFSSPALVPLRKRKDNSSLYKYLQQTESTSQTSTQYPLPSQKTLLCIYERSNYLTTQLQHIFGTIWKDCNASTSLKDKINCRCAHEPEEGTISFKTSAGVMQRHLEGCKNNKNSPRVSTVIKDQHINWFEFGRQLVHQCTNRPFFSEDQLHLFRLPSGTSSETVFSILWNSSYMVFNNGKELAINKHMKARAVQLGEVLRVKLQGKVWEGIQEMIQSNIDRMADHQTFIQKAKKIVSVHSFRMWFYKKQSNNQIYAIAVSDIAFKGVDCVLYKGINLKQVNNDAISELPALEFLQGQTPQHRDYHLIMHKIKTYSLHAQSNNSLNRLNVNKDRLKMLADDNINSCKTLELQKSLAREEEQLVSEVQCQCCKNLLMSSQVMNEIVAKNIQQIRYLRQMKIGKKEFEPYDFVKVCTQCYQIYLKHYKQSLNVKQINQKKTVSFFDYKTKKQQSFVDRVETSSKGDVSRQTSKMLRSRDRNIRVRSQMDKSKDREIENESVKRREKVGGIPKKRKTNTTYTSNTETMDVMESRQRTTNTRAQVRLERILTDHHPRVQITIPRSNVNRSNSNRLRGPLPPKCHNLINKIILNSQTSEATLSQIASRPNQDIPAVREKMLSNAIQEYESLSRPSFKRLLYKNRREGMRREESEGLSEKGTAMYTKGSFHSYKC